MQYRTSSRRGNAAVTALSLGALLGFGAIAVDVAYIRVVNAQLQVAIEAGVLAGAGYLDGSEDGANLALQKAAWVAGLNPLYGGQPLDPDAFELGRYTENGGFVPTNDPDQINAIRADMNYSGFASLLAGAAFGQNTLSTSAGAIALRQVGGPADQVDCFLPIALPACAFPENPTQNPPPIKVGPGNGDTMGWAHPNGANMNNVKGYFQTAGGNCVTSISVGDSLPVMNGVGSANTELTKALNGNNGLQPSPWPEEYFPGGPPARGGDFAFAAPGGNGNGNGNGGGGGGNSSDTSGVTFANWGNTIAGPIAIVEMGTCDANGKPSMKWNQSRVVKGFTWGIIYDQNTANGNSSATWVQVDFLNDHELGTGVNPEAIGNIIVKDAPPTLVRY